MLALVTQVGKEAEWTVVAKRLQDAGFPAAPNVAQALKSIAAKLSGSAEAHEQLATVLADLSASANPGAALVNFLRYLDATGAAGVVLGTMAAGKPPRELLATIFGASQYMSDIVVRNPGYLYWLLEKHVWDYPDTQESHLAELETDVARFATAAGKLNAVRRFQRRILLKIGALDLMGVRTVEETALSLSHLADSITETVLRILWDQSSGGGKGRDVAGFAVLALGKLGGRELNYSSDIDLIYICDDADDATIGERTKLARNLTSALADVSAEGHLYRVDLRLRPDGKAGPLVNPTSALLVYYQNRGRPWEFQAMLKARVIAGDVSLGRTFLDSISALIFNLSLPYSPLDTIALMRSRIRDSISTRDRTLNIKLMEGGIRDIEFIAQALQLMHGGRHAELRISNTVEVLNAARREQLIGKVEHETLVAAYRFFRLVEHRLQMAQQLQTHSLPNSKEELDVLARRVSQGPLGSFPQGQFLTTLTTFINKVRVLSDSFFAGEPLPESTLLILLPEGDELVRIVRHASSVFDHSIARAWDISPLRRPAGSRVVPEGASLAARRHRVHRKSDPDADQLRDHRERRSQHACLLRSHSRIDSPQGDDPRCRGRLSRIGAKARRQLRRRGIASGESEHRALDDGGDHPAVAHDHRGLERNASRLPSDP
jgi:glutamate-ammonia-ligase adenylyltransferase